MGEVLLRGEVEEEDKSKKHTLRRNLSKKVREKFARSVSYPHRGELSRAQSLSSLSIAGTEVQVVVGKLVVPRKVQRKDMPVCWLDQTQVKSRHRSDKQVSTFGYYLQIT